MPTSTAKPPPPAPPKCWRLLAMRACMLCALCFVSLGDARVSRGSGREGWGGGHYYYVLLLLHTCHVLCVSCLAYITVVRLIKNFCACAPSSRCRGATPEARRSSRSSLHCAIKCRRSFELYMNPNPNKPNKHMCMQHDDGVGSLAKGHHIPPLIRQRTLSLSLREGGPERSKQTSIFLTCRGQ